MAHKFKKGDRVRILDGSNIRDYTFGWSCMMSYYVGCEVTIKSFTTDNDKPAYYLDDVPYKWDERGLILVDLSAGGIKDVIFNDPATIVLWKDGTKTVVKCQEGDTYSKELGLAMCISKKYLGNKGNFNEVFKKWIPDETPYTEEELSQLLQNIDFSKIGEALGDILYNFGKSLIEIYGSEKENPGDDISVEEMREALKSYCKGRSCVGCALFSVKHNFNLMTDEEVREAYKLIENKEDK